MKRWALIVGDKGAGKTRNSGHVAELLEARGMSVGGVVQLAVEEEGDRTGYVGQLAEAVRPAEPRP